MSTVDQGHARYRAKYGIDRPPGRADWMPRREYSLDYNLSEFLIRTGMPREKIHEYMWPLEAVVPAATIWDTVLPAMRQLQSDMIGHFLYYLICVPQPLQVGFIRSFVTLVRAHQILFILHAKGQTDGELLASWMVDIFLSPYSIINPPKATGPGVTGAAIPTSNAASTLVPTPDASLELATAPGNTSRGRQSTTVEHIDLTEDVIDLTEEGEGQAEPSTGSGPDPIPEPAPEPEPELAPEPAGMATPEELSDLSFSLDSPIPGSPVREVVTESADPVRQSRDTGSPVRESTIPVTRPAAESTSDPAPQPTARQSRDVSESAPTPTTAARPPIPSEESYRKEMASKEHIGPLNFPRTGIPWELEHFMSKVSHLISNPPKESPRENIMENLIKNLTFDYPPYTHNWPKDMLPDEESFFTPQAAIHYAMLHAHPRFYQLVPRRDEGNFMLYCNRMSPDGVDIFEQTTRKSCKFALRVEHDKNDDEWVLKHVDGCSEHNHAPNTHLSVFQENQPFEPVILDPERFDFTGIVNFGKFIDACNAGYRPTHGDYGLPFHYKGTPDQGLDELLTKTAHVRHVRDENGNLFLTHTQGYRWWKTYPEVMLVDDTEGHMVDETKFHRTVVIRGVDCSYRSFPIAACVCPLNKKNGQISATTWTWIYKQLKELLEDYEVAFPGYIQTTGTFEGIERAVAAFPDAHVQLDDDSVTSWIKETVGKFFKCPASVKKTVKLWKTILFVYDEDLLMDNLADIKRDGSQNDKKCMRAMEKHLKGTAGCYKRQHQHFDVGAYPVHKEKWAVENSSPDHVFAMAECLLKMFVKSYESRSKEHAEELVMTPKKFHNNSLYENVLHTVSYRGLAKAEYMNVWAEHNGSRYGPNDNCDCLWETSSGGPCVHEVVRIKATRGKLCPSDFHPRWRNIQADLAPVDLSGQGRYANDWAALKTGPEVYDPEFSETTDRPTKRRRVG